MPTSSLFSSPPSPTAVAFLSKTQLPPCLLRRLLTCAIFLSWYLDDHNAGTGKFAQQTCHYQTSAHFVDVTPWDSLLHPHEVAVYRLITKKIMLDLKMSAPCAALCGPDARRGCEHWRLCMSHVTFRCQVLVGILTRAPKESRPRTCKVPPRRSRGGTLQVPRSTFRKVAREDHARGTSCTSCHKNFPTEK